MVALRRRERKRQGREKRVRWQVLSLFGRWRICGWPQWYERKRGAESDSNVFTFWKEGIFINWHERLQVEHFLEKRSGVRFGECWIWDVDENMKNILELGERSEISNEIFLLHMIKYENMDVILKIQNYMEHKLKFLHSLIPNPLPSPAAAIKQQHTIWENQNQHLFFISTCILPQAERCLRGVQTFMLRIFLFTYIFPLPT